MNEEASHQSHALRWTLGVVTALLLYVLSFGPVVGLSYRGTIPIPMPKWLHNFYLPAYWLQNGNTSLARPFRRYVNWWIHILAES